MAPPIEVTATPQLRLGMSPAAFLRDYWQKRPLLIRQAFAGFQPPLAPEDLAGLACEEAALSRLIVRDARRDRWAVRSGPLDESDFGKLPKTHWTLLVQDVDKWDADVAALVESFDFLPRWRIDDIMISYAVDGGGVGAHVDQYDVFLLQGMGRRRWRISDDPAAPKAFRDDVELKILRQFDPSHDWVLEPGDMLYLPPGVPHDGVAEGDCMTFSLGMRAPSVAELMMDLVDHVVEPLTEDDRYADPDLTAPADPHQITPDALQRVEHALSRLRQMDTATLHEWFGHFITGYRSAQTAHPPEKTLTPAQLAAEIDKGSHAVRYPWSRTAWMPAADDTARLFVGGHAFGCSVPFARLVCASRELDNAALKALPAADQSALLALVNDGQLLLVRPRRGRKA
ncbi:cupin domain-containing protein [Tahibacter amnicola]|uniref:Cupin domain-containing protein n=1 Tax=Tahibacter amnicola TaxID=2976241 RepID=A0ABY6BK64_9GAMM|nr:cupin domain-containing protein [Tahibacter amnicola]UXI70401.1 cupin domain-containing protein [Tahibacter amnicola]